jgi:hypothetical protein
MYLRTADGGSLVWPGLAQATPTNLVLVSGGPGLYDDRDVEHDKSWANYVTPPLLLSDTPRKACSFRRSRDPSVVVRL